MRLKTGIPQVEFFVQNQAFLAQRESGVLLIASKDSGLRGTRRPRVLQWETVTEASMDDVARGILISDVMDL